MRHVDTLFLHCTVVPGGGDCAVIRDGFVAVEAGRVESLGTFEDMPSYRARETYEVTGRLIMPGLVDAGTTALIGNRTGLQDISNDHEISARPQVASRSEIAAACRQLAESGTTALCHIGAYADAAARLASTYGMRICVVVPPEDIEGMLSAWQGNDLVSVAVDLSSWQPPTIAQLRWFEDILSRAPMRAFVGQRDRSIEQEGALSSILGSLLSAGIVRIPLITTVPSSLKLLTADLLGRFDISILHSPYHDSSQQLLANLAAMCGDGLSICLGSLRSDRMPEARMFHVLRRAAMINKVADPTAFPVGDVFRMATANGANALGWGSVAGNLTAGMSADLAVIDMRSPHLTPVYDHLSHLVYVVRPGDVCGTMVRGEWLYRDSAHLDILARHCVYRGEEASRAHH